MEDGTITITMEEYKELLIIKGKYEELKSQQNYYPNWNPSRITYRGTGELMPPYKVTCGSSDFETDFLNKNIKESL